MLQHEGWHIDANRCHIISLSGCMMRIRCVFAVHLLGIAPEIEASADLYIQTPSRMLYSKDIFNMDDMDNQHCGDCASLL